MYTGLVHAHSGLRWVALVLLLAAVFVSVSRWMGNKSFTEGNRKLYLFTLISVHTQLVIGLILYFISPKVDFSGMSNRVVRFYSVEHITIMLLAIIAITIGYSRSKRASGDTQKHRLVGLFYGVGLILILAGIPWAFRNLGAGTF
ncbi:cytochrome B [Fibrella forsythiae]|uniref:Cytochrome B n=1 Tax=Fibrella forsythiae TaxID=2817061 RepID=A0ABS3JNH1_9BACT|nr:cytochrome B [Fibrella forsythiae]MBO0951525.1 cytochrome B [Fibrella forsythiae]